MDKRVKYLIGVDTETCNGILVDDKLDLTQSLVYDIGWQVTDKKGRVYQKRSYIVKEIFFGMADLMQSAYYANKIPMYKEQIKSGQRIVKPFLSIWKQFREDCKTYGVSAIFAHNARFDVNALNNTIRYISCSKFRYFFPYGIDIWDTLKMSNVIAQQKGYQKYCLANGFMTKHKKPRVRQTAEILYRYISGQIDFEECHTGLEDVEIETKILAHCFRQHKPMNKLLFAKGV